MSANHRLQQEFWHDKRVFITGASSGIGWGLAIKIAKMGAQVGLFARRAQRLDELVRHIRADGGSAVALPGDVSSRETVHRAIAQFVHTAGPIDVLIANAGRGTGGGDEADGQLVADVHSVNFLGAVYAFEAVLPSMRDRGRGHVAVVSSGTALLPKLAASPAYASSKEALGRYFEGIGRELRYEGIQVSVAYPGFVRTPMTANHKWTPFAVDVDRAARLICRAVERGRPKLLFPRRVFWLGKLIAWLPTRLQMGGRHRLSGKPEEGAR